MGALADLINPFALYAGLALGALGVALALPRRGPNPQPVGAILAAAAAGLVILALSWRAHKIGASADAPNPFFYVFGVVGLGAALRVITHPRPVYAALWFIMTVVSTAGLFVLLSAEFMMAAIIIVYAGAILITYLFVIMLATQAPEEGESDVLAPYDTFAREPAAATLVGFILLGVLTTMLFRGTAGLGPPASAPGSRILAHMPRKIETGLERAGALNAGEHVVVSGDGRATLDLAARTVRVAGDGGAERTVALPADVDVTNVEQLGFNLLRDHPGTIEIAGVILLMAMLGAVVLSRKQVQLDEDAKLRHARRLSQGAEGRA